MALAVCAVSIAFAPHALHSAFPGSRASRSPVPVAGEPLPPRDPLVEKATGGGWSGLLPARRNLIAVGTIGCISALLPDTPLGQLLNAPPLQTEKSDVPLDDAGIAFKTEQTLVPGGGLAVLVGYQLIRRLAAPRLEEAARERRAAEQEATSTAADSKAAAPADDESGGPQAS